MKKGLVQFFNKYWILILLIAIKFILQVILVNPVYELHRDEFLYLDQADHLAFGYISVPPFTALVSKMIYLLGGSVFWVRFFPALFGSLTIIFTWLIVESLGGSLIAKVTAAMALVFSLLVRINILFQPNSFDILIWTIIFYLLIKFIQSENKKWLFLLAIVVAAGFYNKYNVIFLVAGLFIGLVVTPERKIFLNPSFWIAMLISLLLLAPNIAWQVNHHFPVIQHMTVLKHNQLDNNSALGFLKGQVAFFLGSLGLTIGGLVGFITIKAFRPYRFVAICFVSSMLIFAMMKAKDYYALGLFPVMFAFGCVFFDTIILKRRKFIFSLLIAINLAVFLLLVKIVFPVLSPADIRKNAFIFEKFGVLRWEDGKNHNLPQDFADMIGWKEMAAKALSAYKLLPPEDMDSTLVICDNYGQAGALNFYNRKKMLQAYTFNTDYIYWMPRLKQIKNILLVGDKPDDKIIALFNSVTMQGKIENPEAREKDTAIWLLTGANVSLTKLFYDMVEDRIKRLDIF